MANRANVKIQTRGILNTKVLVNGKELQGIRKISFSQIPGNLPELHIALQATDLMIDGENVMLSLETQEAKPEGMAST